MKLYTEKQVVNAIQITVMDKPITYAEVLEKLIPIKLPSDEEIEAAASDTYRDHPNNPKEHPDWTYNKDVNAPRKRRAFNIGAHWVLNQIKQQDNEMV